jgi:hypothetical protein
VTREGVAKQFDSSRTEQGRDDDKLARRLADAVAVNDPTLVLGNHLSDPEPRVHYHEKQTDKGKPANELGYSLGDWGPVDVVDGRPGAPVFTIETYQNHESWAFDGATGGQRMDEGGQPLRDLSGRVYPDAAASRPRPGEAATWPGPGDCQCDPGLLMRTRFSIRSTTASRRSGALVVGRAIPQTALYLS